MSVDFSQLIAKYKGEMVDLKGKDFEILAFFLKNKGRILSREVMLDGIWPMGEYPSDRIIDVYVKNLRKKLHLNCIETIKGMGYRFNGQ